MDFDPRDFDSRDDERHANTPGRERTSDSNQHHREGRTRDSGRDDARSLGRGPASNQKVSGRNQAHRDHGSRSRERVLDARDRDREPRDTFNRHLWLPSGPDREIVRDRDREYTLRGSESRTLATVGAFRVVSSRDLVDHNNRPADPRSGDLRHANITCRTSTTRCISLTLASSTRSQMAGGVVRTSRSPRLTIAAPMVRASRGLDSRAIAA